MGKEAKTGTSYLIVQFIESTPFDNNMNGSKYGTYPKMKEINKCKRKIKVKCSPGSQSSSVSANECPLNLSQIPPMSAIISYPFQLPLPPPYPSKYFIPSTGTFDILNAGLLPPEPFTNELLPTMQNVVF
ncbi:hypothetical protein ACB098_11G035100 [Castanea mollissima]